MEAARRYDPSKGCKFVTYAMWWIRKAILDALTRYSNLLSISGYYRRKLREIRHKDRELEAALGRKPRRDEIDAALGQPSGRAEALLGRHRRALSLDDGSRVHGGLPLADRVEDPNAENPEEQLIRRETRTRVREAVNDLSSKQRRVIALRFGLDGREPLTLTDIGKAMDLSRERIRQIETQGKNRLRKLLGRGQWHRTGESDCCQ
jgi:RNA polymerase primary sigma factor